MGIEPTYPSSKYGYILPENEERISSVRGFREKPDEETAQRYIEQGALWNGGIFAFRLGYLLKELTNCWILRDIRIYMTITDNSRGSALIMPW